MQQNQPAAPAGGDFEALYRRHVREVWAFAYSQCLDAELARDATQEAFLRLWQVGGVVLHPRAWLRRVARNLTRDYAKSSFRRHGTCAPEGLDGLSSSCCEAPELLEREERFARVRQEVAGMGPRDREVLTLRYALDFSPADIAEALGVSYDAVLMRLCRAKRQLAARLLRQGVTR
jgi:RNA polymerase sigma-70 factor (ECF subfamily)